jgi:hypothetical protein
LFLAFQCFPLFVSDLLLGSLVGIDIQATISHAHGAVYVLFGEGTMCRVAIRKKVTGSDDIVSIA